MTRERYFVFWFVRLYAPLPSVGGGFNGVWNRQRDEHAPSCDHRAPTHMNSAQTILPLLISEGSGSSLQRLDPYVLVQCTTKRISGYLGVFIETEEERQVLEVTINVAKQT
jgi:hypothetical protein